MNFQQTWRFMVILAVTGICAKLLFDLHSLRILATCLQLFGCTGVIVLGVGRRLGFFRLSPSRSTPSIP
jgi:hypothetical protein